MLNISKISVDDRVEVYTGSTGTYWGYVVAVDAATVALDDISPNSDRPAVVLADDVTRIVHHGRRPEGHVGRWNGNR